MRTTSVTDLKARLSLRLKQVQNGESLVVTDHNRPVALLQPLPAGSGNERLVALTAAGVVSPPGRPMDIDAFRAMPSARCAVPLSAAIVEERNDR